MCSDLYASHSSHQKLLSSNGFSSMQSARLGHLAAQNLLLMQKLFPWSLLGVSSEEVPPSTAWKAGRLSSGQTKMKCLFIWNMEVKATLISWPRDFGGSSCPSTPMLVSHQNGKRGETNLLVILSLGKQVVWN